LRLWRRAPKPRYLGGLELAPRAGLEPFERQSRVAGAMETADGMADGLAHPLDLVLAPLVERQLDRRGPEEPGLRRRRKAVVELDTFPGGLCSRTYASRCAVTASPSTSTRSPRSTNVFSCPGAQFTRTRPALISSSAPRRDATPARAR